MKSRLPVADLEAHARQRREAGKQATERRLERERGLARRAADWLGEDLIEFIEFRGQMTIVTKLARSNALLTWLRDELEFDMMVDLTAVDYMKLEGDYPERFGLVYHLANTVREARLRVRTYVAEEDPRAPTASNVYKAANWAEREVYDMFGLEFDDHSNLIRILLPLEYSGHPLRKDYPLRGRGERDNFPVIRRDREDEA
ncbi:MAG: NADH-quinone oxidoreductase subunit C [Planctomycetes bacterium]|nr:NADH-quinone oxidoreductase subunit C [Planctomycetota bacterium]